MMKNKKLKILLAKPRGFCAGVDRAIEIVKKSIEKYGAPVYVRHEIVHNKEVVQSLKKIGAIFVEELSEISDKSRPVIFSAHGVPKSVTKEAENYKMEFIDATCPLVSKVHREAENHYKAGNHILLIGHKNHPEVIGTMGQIPSGKIDLIETIDDAKKYEIKNSKKIAYVTQTTLSVDDTKDIIAELKKRFPEIEGPDVKDICYATQNRQSAVRDLVVHVDLMLVVGAKNSSNSNRLRDLGEESGVDTYLIETANDLDSKWFNDLESVGISSGASTPDELVNEVIDRISSFRKIKIEKRPGIEENVVFKLPKELVDNELTN